MVGVGTIGRGGVLLNFEFGHHFCGSWQNTDNSICIWNCIRCWSQYWFAMLSYLVVIVKRRPGNLVLYIRNPAWNLNEIQINAMTLLFYNTVKAYSIC